MGGKSRVAKQIAAIIDEHRQPGQLVWDTFCGGLSVSVALSKKGPVLASDFNLSLISLYSSIRSGWEPPTETTAELYQVAKTLPDWSKYTDVFVSEYEFPLGRIVWSHKAKTTLAATNKLREERLYHIPKST